MKMSTLQRKFTVKTETMTNDFWLNLPVKDISLSKVFYTELGFTFKPLPGNNPGMACLLVGDKEVMVMLCEESMFKKFTGNDVPGSKNTEVLFSFSASSREEVDGWAAKAEKAGGSVFGKPGESQGWMYGCGFADVDGHRWNALFMDMSKMPG